MNILEARKILFKNCQLLRKYCQKTIRDIFSHILYISYIRMLRLAANRK